MLWVQRHFSIGKTAVTTDWPRPARWLSVLALLIVALLVIPAHVTHAGEAAPPPAGLDAAPCTVPSISYPNIFFALADPNCDPILLQPGIYNQPLAINRSVTIQGNGTLASQVILSGGNTFRPITIGADNIIVVIDTLTIANGDATGEATPNGGGLLNTFVNSTVTIIDSEVSGNTAVDGGGLYNDGILNLENALVSANTATNDGGGLYNADDATILNTTFTGNTTTANGGNVYNAAGATLDVDYATIVNGNATGTGDGLFNAGTANLAATLLADNGADCTNTGAATDGGYNIVESSGLGLDCGFATNISSGTFVGIAPRFGSLTANGGPTESILQLAGSIGIKQIPAGTNGCGTTVTADQRGESRPEIDHCDIGAVEGNCTEMGFTFPYTVGLAPNSDGAQELRGAIACANANTTADTITLTDDVALRVVDNNLTGDNGLPRITSEITLEGAGFTLSRDAAYTSCDGTFPEFRLLLVRPSGALTVHDLTLTNGCISTSFSLGTALRSSGALTVTNSAFLDNHNTTSGIGGTLGIATGTAVIQNSTVTANTTTSVVGGVMIQDATALITGSTIANNEAAGLRVQRANVSVVNSTISGHPTHNVRNISTLGFSSHLTLTHATITGGDIGIISDVQSGGTAATTTLAATVIADHTTGDCDFPTNPISVTLDLSSGYNIDGDGSCFGGAGTVIAGPGNITAPAPGLAPLADNGGPTLTHALLGDSAAVDHVPAASCGLATDQRGESRPQVIACDAGAVEMSCSGLGYAYPYTIGTVNGNYEQDLVTAVACANANATADTITLAAPITMTGIYTGENALPAINSVLTIIGAGHSLERDPAYTSCDGTFPDFRFFEIAPSGDLTLNGVRLQNGCATIGGAIYSKGTLSLTLSTLADNIATIGSADGGGGLMVDGGGVDISRSTFVGNSAFRGGAIMMRRGSLVLESAMIMTNTAGTSGGGLYVANVADAVIQFTTFSGNSATNSGGGIFNNSFTTVSNTTFGNNQAGSGGGGVRNADFLLLSYTTFSGNTAAPGAGGGVRNNSGQTLRLQGNIIANSPQGGDCINEGSVIDNGYNLISQTGSNACDLTSSLNSPDQAPGNIIGADPLLGPLADNGGPTFTFALLTGSPAINAGNNAACPTVDQRGITRPQGGVCDIGAFELEATPTAVTLRSASTSAAPGLTPLLATLLLLALATPFTLLRRPQV